MTAAVVASTGANAQAKIADESDIGGVFAQGRKVTPEQNARAAEAIAPKRAAVFFRALELDAGGAANQIVLQVDTDPARNEIAARLAETTRCATVVACANAFVDSVNSRTDTALLSSLAQPLGARFLIEDYRMSDKERTNAASDDPALALQRFVVLRYTSVDAARTALKSLSKRPDVTNAALRSGDDLQHWLDMDGRERSVSQLAKQSGQLSMGYGTHELSCGLELDTR